MAELQTIDSQKGEIAFRRMLVEQQVQGQERFRDEHDAAGIEAILEKRMEETRRQMALLKGKGFTLVPYLEIGAERGQRSLVLENDLGLSGAAADISLHMLKSCEHYQKVFQKKLAPMRICCDVNNLPFAANSLPFVFCYETLHHFPEPAPVIREVHRVLAPGGCFLFNDEPFRKILHLPLYKRDKVYSGGFHRRGKFRRLLDYFFGTMNCNETDFGIIENHDLPLGAWKSALGIFEEKHIHLEPRLFGSVRSVQPGSYARLGRGFRPRAMARAALAWLFGGVISGICRKAGLLRRHAARIVDAIICPECRAMGREIRPVKKPEGFQCQVCNSWYPVTDGIVLLFSRQKLQELYPDLIISGQWCGC